MKSLIKSHVKTSAVHEQPQAAKNSDLLTVSEVARILRVDDTTVRRWVRQGVLEAVILPHATERRSYRVRRSTLNRIMHSNTPMEK